MKIKDTGDSPIKLGMYLGAKFKVIEDKIDIMENEFIKLRDRIVELERISKQRG